MSEDLHNYIRQAREGGADQQTIKDRLIGAGWHPETVGKALYNQGEQASVPAAPLAMSAEKAQMPIPVVQMLSTRGVEYYLLMIALAISAISLGFILHSIAAHLFGGGSYALTAGAMSFAASVLIVSLPLFVFFFLRLKKDEVANPGMLLEPSRRRAIQIMLIVSFLAGIISIASYIFAFFSLSYGGTDTESNNWGLTISDFVITTLIIGGIFVYYWMDSHRKGGR